MEQKIFNRSNLLVLGMAIILFGCIRWGDKWTIKIYGKSGHLSKIYEINKDSIKDGFFREYYDNDSLAELSTYTNGKLSGQRKIFYPNGILKGVENYSNDLMHGSYVYFYDDGNVKESGNMRDGLPFGRRLVYHPIDSGKIVEESYILIVNGKAISSKYFRFDGIGDTLQSDPYVIVEMDDSIKQNVEYNVRLRVLKPQEKYTIFQVQDFTKPLDTLQSNLDSIRFFSDHQAFRKISPKEKGKFYLRGIAIHFSEFKKKPSGGYIIKGNNIYFEKEYFVY